LCDEELFQSVEAGVSELVVSQNPAREMPQGMRGQLKCVVAAAASTSDEPSSFEDPHMLAKARERHWEALGNVGNARGAGREALDDSAPRGVGDRGGDAE
jgi:hypothetical protein